MPVYEYECKSCGGRFEVTLKFSDPPLGACALCKSAEIRKILSPTSFVLKGSGWYATDYASDRKKSEQAEKPCGDAKPAAAGCSSAACASGACAAKE